MEKSLCNAMSESGENLTAKVLPHPDLTYRKVDFNQFIGKEVIIDPEDARVIKTKSGDKINVKIRLKENPSVFKTIFTNYLEPLSENCKNFFKIENHI